MEKTPSRFQVELVESGSQIEIPSAPSAENPVNKDLLNVCAIDLNDPNVYDSRSNRSLRHYTHEALPRLDHYRNVHSLHAHFPRPTLDELHNGDIVIPENQVSFCVIIFTFLIYVYFLFSRVYTLLKFQFISH